MHHNGIITSIDRLRQTLKYFFNSALFNSVIILLLLTNAVILGFETYPCVMKAYGPILNAIDNIILYIFVLELSFKLMAYGPHFFRDGWNIFDLFLVIISLASDNAEAFSALRAVRISRVLRLISVSSSLRNIVEGFLRAIPNLSSISAILLILFYICAVIATKLFGSQFPEFFGDLQSSLFSLFQIMTLEGWPEIARSVMKVYPHAWIFFVTYILIATFSVLNLFIAVIVDAVQKQTNIEAETGKQNVLHNIQSELKILQIKIDQFQQGLLT